eukprot:gene7473-11797_t
MKSSLYLVLVLFDMAFGYPLIKLQKQNFDFSKIHNQKTHEGEFDINAVLSALNLYVNVSLPTQILSIVIHQMNQENITFTSSHEVVASPKVGCTKLPCCCCCC